VEKGGKNSTKKQNTGDNRSQPEKMIRDSYKKDKVRQ